MNYVEILLSFTEHKMIPGLTQKHYIGFTAIASRNSGYTTQSCNCQVLCPSTGGCHMENILVHQDVKIGLFLWPLMEKDKSMSFLMESLTVGKTGSCFDGQCVPAL